MGAIPSREFHEDPANVWYAQVGETKAVFIPLTPHFFPSCDCLAFQQLYEARKHQSAKYYFVPLSATPAVLDEHGKPMDSRKQAADANAAAEGEATRSRREKEKAEDFTPPSSSYLLDHEPRLIPFLSEPDRPKTFRAVQPLQVEGAPMDAVMVAPRKPILCRYEAVAGINADNYQRFFSDVKDHCVEDETMDLATVPRCNESPTTPKATSQRCQTPAKSPAKPATHGDDDDGELIVSEPQTMPPSTTKTATPSASPRSPNLNNNNNNSCHNRGAPMHLDVSVAYDRHCRNREYYYYGSVEPLYSILVERQAHHVLDTNAEMCALYAQEGEWVAGRRRLRQARMRAQSQARRRQQQHDEAGSQVPSHNVCVSELPPPPREFIRPISEAVVVFMTIEDEAHAIADHLDIFVEEAMTRVLRRALRPATTARTHNTTPRLRYRFENNTAYRDGRIHLVDEDGVLYVFAYKKNASSSGVPGDLDCVDAFAIPIQAVRVFGANCLIESWCRATPWTRGLDDDPEEDAYIEFEMATKPPVMRPAWFLDARVGGERLFAQLSCKESVVYSRMCRTAGLPGPLVRPGWEKDPLFGLPMLQTSRRLSAYISAKLREAAASGELANRTLDDIRNLLSSSQTDGATSWLDPGANHSSMSPAEKQRIDDEVIETLLKLANIDDKLSLIEDDADGEDGELSHISAAEVQSRTQRALTVNAVRELIHQCDIHHVKIDGISASAFRQINEHGEMPQRNSRYRSTFSVRGNYGIVRARVEGLLFFFKIYDILGLDDNLLDEALAVDETQPGEDAHIVYPAAPPASATPPENFSEQLYDYGGTVRVHCLRAPPSTRPIRPTDMSILEIGADDGGGAMGASPPSTASSGRPADWWSEYVDVPHVASFVRPPEEAQVLPPPANMAEVYANYVNQEKQWAAWRQYLIDCVATETEEGKASANKNSHDAGEGDGDVGANAAQNLKDEPLPANASEDKAESEAGGLSTAATAAASSASQAAAPTPSELVPVMVFVAVNTSRLAEGPSSTHAAYVQSILTALEQSEAAATTTATTPPEPLALSEMPPHRFMYPAHHVLDSQLLVYNVVKGEWEHLSVATRRNALRCERIMREVASTALNETDPASATVADKNATGIAETDAASPPPSSSTGPTSSTIIPGLAATRNEVSLVEVLVCWIKRVQRQIPLTNRHDPGWLRDTESGRIVQEGRYYIYSFEKAGELFYCGVVPHFATDRRKMKKKMLREAAAAAAASSTTAASSVTTISIPPTMSPPHAEPLALSRHGSQEALPLSFVNTPTTTTPPPVRRHLSNASHNGPTTTTVWPAAAASASREVLTAASSSSALNLECGSGLVPTPEARLSGSPSVSPYPESAGQPMMGDSVQYQQPPDRSISPSTEISEGGRGRGGRGVGGARRGGRGATGGGSSSNNTSMTTGGYRESMYEYNTSPLMMGSQSGSSHNVNPNPSPNGTQWASGSVRSLQSSGSYNHSLPQPPPPPPPPPPPRYASLAAGMAQPSSSGSPLTPAQAASPTLSVGSHSSPGSGTNYTTSYYPPPPPPQQQQPQQQQQYADLHMSQPYGQLNTSGYGGSMAAAGPLANSAMALNYSQPRQYTQVPLSSQPGPAAPHLHGPLNTRPRPHSEKVSISLAPHPIEDCGLAASSPMRTSSMAPPQTAMSESSASSSRTPAATVRTVAVTDTNTTAAAATMTPTGTGVSQKPLGKSGRYVWNPYGVL